MNVGILRGRDLFAALAAAEGGDIATLQRRVDITVSGEFMVGVFARDPDPEWAKRLANLVPAKYAEFHENSMRAGADPCRCLVGGFVAQITLGIHCLNPAW